MQGAYCPLIRSAQGTLPGEGGTALVLKRLEDAIAEKDRIYAIINGFGAASGMAYGKLGPYHRKRIRYPSNVPLQEADIGLSEISLFEAHGSGLHDEDAIESNVLNAISSRHRAALCRQQHQTDCGTYGRGIRPASL